MAKGSYHIMINPYSEDGQRAIEFLESLPARKKSVIITELICRYLDGYLGSEDVEKVIKKPSGDKKKETYERVLADLRSVVMELKMDSEVVGQKTETSIERNEEQILAEESAFKRSLPKKEPLDRMQSVLPLVQENIVQRDKDEEVANEELERIRRMNEEFGAGADMFG